MGQYLFMGQKVYGGSCLVSGWHPSALLDELGGLLVNLGTGGGDIVLWLDRSVFV